MEVSFNSDIVVTSYFFINSIVNNGNGLDPHIFPKIHKIIRFYL